jgi:multidrug transporter EmrE-like cation transporter
MSIPQIFSLALVEIVGDYGLKEYANTGGWHYLATGLVGYVSLVILLIIALQGSTLLLVNNAWDGASSILESLFAFFILGERFDNYMQYLGMFMVIGGMMLLKIPWKKAHPFHIPSMKGGDNLK